jgi:hypothetical protein
MTTHKDVRAIILFGPGGIVWREEVTIAIVCFRIVFVSDRLYLSAVSENGAEAKK